MDQSKIRMEGSRTQQYGITIEALIYQPRWDATPQFFVCLDRCMMCTDPLETASDAIEYGRRLAYYVPNRIEDTDERTRQYYNLRWIAIQ
jgi:hypothetical protein